MAILLNANLEYAENGRPEDFSQLTVFMNVSYKAPVRTPCVVMVQAECTKVQGRKRFISVRLEDAQRLCASAEGMYISARSERL